jgi:hypothetical protein
MLDQKVGLANKVALDFVENLEKQNAQISSSTSSEDVKSVVLRYNEFVQVLDTLLFERKTSLLPRQVTVFTTNYDTFLETAVSTNPAIVLNDGFDRTSPAAGEFTFSPEKFSDRIFRSGTVYSRMSEVPTFNLVKLHGSLNWKQSEKQIKYSFNSPISLTEEEKNDPQKVEESLSTRALILPNRTKFQSVMLDRVYYDQLRVYSKSLEMENSVLLVFGFSFADEHILDITKRALRNPTAQVIIFSYDEPYVDVFGYQFVHHRNVHIVKPPVGGVLDFGAFNKVLSQILQPDTENDS